MRHWMQAGTLAAALFLGTACSASRSLSSEQPPPSAGTGGSGTSVGSGAGNPAGESQQRLANYEISSTQSGQPSIQLALTFMPGDKTVQGTGNIHENTAPPLVPTEVFGTTRSQNAPEPGSTLVVATGRQPIHLPPHSGHGPALPENLELRMVLAPDGRTGEASYKFRPNAGTEWIEVKDATVKRIEIR